MSYQDWRCRDCGWVTVWEKAALAHAERMRHVVERFDRDGRIIETVERLPEPGVEAEVVRAHYAGRRLGYQLCEEDMQRRANAQDEGQVRVHEGDEGGEREPGIEPSHPISPATASEAEERAYSRGWREGFGKGELYGRVRVEREAKQRRKEKRARQEQGIYKEEG